MIRTYSIAISAIASIQTDQLELSRGIKDRASSPAVYASSYIVPASPPLAPGPAAVLIGPTAMHKSPLNNTVVNSAIKPFEIPQNR